MLTLQIPDINPSDQQLAAAIRTEISCLLYQQQVWSLGQAATFAGLAYIQFQDLLAAKNILLNYGQSDLEQDLNEIDKFLAE